MHLVHYWGARTLTSIFEHSYLSTFLGGGNRNSKCEVSASDCGRARFCWLPGPTSFPAPHCITLAISLRGWTPPLHFDWHLPTRAGQLDPASESCWQYRKTWEQVEHQLAPGSGLNCAVPEADMRGSSAGQGREVAEAAPTPGPTASNPGKGLSPTDP